jgi:hypothetical protein
MFITKNADKNRQFQIRNTTMCHGLNMDKLQSYGNDLWAGKYSPECLWHETIFR